MSSAANWQKLNMIQDISRIARNAPISVFTPLFLFGEKQLH